MRSTELPKSQLTQSLINGGKTLVIFDDVWDVIFLNKIGIPFGDGRSKGCKILFTSRRQDVCLGNKCVDPIEIKTLTVNEAWDMFKEAVGSSKIDSLRDPFLAEKVCRKCGRLPLLINAVGKAVKFMTENSWKDALYQLENCSYEEITGMGPEVYPCLLLSFQKLSEAGKACLLLCSLFPEDAYINIKELSYLATGSPLLNGPRNIAGVVDILKSSSLLLQGEDDNAVKLHDIIRDVARSIAAKDPKYGFLSIRWRSGWLDNTDYATRRLLHLNVDEDNVCFPKDLVCADLHTLWLQCEISYLNWCPKLSSGFSEGLTDLRFLLQGTKFPEQELSINRLEKLMIIILEGCHIDETFFSFVPQSLQTLCIDYCILPSPLDLSKLKNLRKLKLVDSDEIEMVPQSISSLSRLEELNIPGGITLSDDANDNSTSLYKELNKLIQLTNLTIRLPYSKSCLDRDIMSNLVEFNLAVGSDPNNFFGMSEKSIRFRGNCLESGWMPLVERADDVYFDSVKGLSKHTEAFANVKKLKITSCDDIDHLVRLPVDGRNQPYFSNLCSLKIEECGELTYLFPASVANCLQKLQKLKVYRCKSIEEIVRADHGEVTISFPKLKVLYLFTLPRLKSFSIRNKVAFPSLEEMEIKEIDNASDLWGKGIYNQEGSPSFTQLKMLNVEFCDQLENVIPVTLDHELNNLERLHIICCKSLKSVFQLSSTATEVIESDGSCMVFSSLKLLQLEELPNIKSFFSCDAETLEMNPTKSPRFHSQTWRNSTLGGVELVVSQSR